VPERVLTVRLDGAAEYETSDGEARHVPAGGSVPVEDTHGKGTSIASRTARSLAGGSGLSSNRESPRRAE
jgi:hypothetical protein